MDVDCVELIKALNCPSPAGISVSSLSDGLFVLHVPSDDNKQKVKPRMCHEFKMNATATEPQQISACMNACDFTVYLFYGLSRET